MAENNFDIIKRYMFDPDQDGILLNETQKAMMDRWNFVIELKTCEQLGTNDIIKKLMDPPYSVSRMTAYNDIGNAEALFGYSTPLNLRFRIGARINFLEEKINSLYKLKRYLPAARLEATLADYYKMYPELKKENGVQTLDFTFGQKELFEGEPIIEDALYTLIEETKDK